MLVLMTQLSSPTDGRTHSSVPRGLCTGCAGQDSAPLCLNNFSPDPSTMTPGEASVSPNAGQSSGDSLHSTGCH